MLYANFLKKEYNVTAIAISGESDHEKKISIFLWLKDAYLPKEIPTDIILNSKQLDNIITEQKAPLREELLIEKAIFYNDILHANSIPETERCTVISSILVALQNKTFIEGYNTFEHYKNDRFMEFIITSCKNVLEDKKLSQDKIIVIIDEYSKYKNNKKLVSPIIKDKKTKQEKPNTILKDLITDINHNILPYIKNDNFDVLGKFYTLFIKYAGSDKKTGLVLTPPHITDFFCDLVNLTKDDIVFDPCCGTGGFLVSAMNKMLKDAKYDEEKQNSIKETQIIGVEIREDMFSYACSNMMMRGDGKSHIYYSSCFDKKIISTIKNKQPTISFLNPPYQDGNADEQLEFIENSLACLIKNGQCVAICQMSTALNTKAFYQCQMIYSILLVW